MSDDKEREHCEAVALDVLIKANNGMFPQVGIADLIQRERAAARERDSLRAKLAEVEAQAAAMRAVLERSNSTYGSWIVYDDAQAALAPDAGRALLAEVKVLREVATAAGHHRKCRCQTYCDRLDRALAKLDALKGGSR